MAKEAFVRKDRANVFVERYLWLRRCRLLSVDGASTKDQAATREGLQPE
jgi:hypothetical protein